MATLIDKFNSLQFNLVPVLPLPAGPHNAYDVTMHLKKKLLFQHRFTIYDDNPDGHWNVWRLFRALQLTETLAAHQAPFNLTGRQNGQFNEAATLSIDIGWLHAILSADRLIHKHSHLEPVAETRSSLIIYLLTGTQELDTNMGDYKQFRLECRPSEIVAFGQALELECREALRVRRQTGRLAPADEYIDD